MVIVGASVFLSAVISISQFVFSAETNSPSRPANWAQKIERPGLPNLHQVTTNLFRGAQPTAEGMKELESRFGMRLLYRENKGVLLSANGDSGRGKTTCLKACASVWGNPTPLIVNGNVDGSTMNAMLKAQMLATALDVYFSGSSLGGNRIGAPVAIGGVVIDLILPENAGSAFGGATSMTVSGLLAYASSQSSSGGGTWYGNNKAIQGLAKDLFDNINNQTAFPV